LPELAIPFNQDLGNYQVNDDGEISNSSNGAMTTRGYLVDGSGEIEFPILGTLKVEGITLAQLKHTIKKKLINGKLINDPIIKVELLNLKINMMGEVSSVGVLNVPD